MTMEEAKDPGTLEQELPRSKVDAFFDALTGQTAKGLLRTQTVLEELSRWIEARAKVFGELATKLTAP